MSWSRTTNHSEAAVGHLRGARDSHQRLNPHYRNGGFGLRLFKQQEV
ncbi:hypothetical protein [Enterobacter phage 02_vB_Eclo_IJM]|nr:hypothetical protein [Enterobacter phage 02_vB_Eclo_IJM]